MTTEQEERDQLAEKASKVFQEVAESNAKPVEGGADEPVQKRYEMGKSLLDLELSDAMFSGRSIEEGGTHRTYLDGVDISPVLQGIQINADINGVNKIILHMIGLPMRVRMLGVVEIESKGADKIADEFLARAEEAERQRTAALLERKGAVGDETYDPYEPNNE